MSSPEEAKRKSMHERLGFFPIIKKYTNFPLGVEPSRVILSAVFSRMRREADINIFCGEVLQVQLEDYLAHFYTRIR